MPFDLSSDIGGFYSFFGSDVIYTTTISVNRDSLYVNGTTEGTFSSDVFLFHFIYFQICYIFSHSTKTNGSSFKLHVKQLHMKLLLTVYTRL